MRVTVKPGDTWAASTPEQVLPGDALRVGGDDYPMRTYDISRDGRTFLALKKAPMQNGAAAAPTMIVVQNWLEELKRRVPAR